MVMFMGERSFVRMADNGIKLTFQRSAAGLRGELSIRVTVSELLMDLEFL